MKRPTLVDAITHRVRRYLHKRLDVETFAFGRAVVRPPDPSDENRKQKGKRFVSAKFQGRGLR
ncbi:MAG: hypothetical protein AAFV53_18955 [Myxococcota bacterium]